MTATTTERRRAARPRYVPAGPIDLDKPQVCLRCGALVAKTALEIHDQRDRRIAAALERLAGIDDQMET